MSELNVLMRFQGLLPGARASTCPMPRYWMWSL